VKTPPAESSLIDQAEAAAAKKDWTGAAGLLSAAPASIFTRSRRAFYLSRAGAYKEAYAIFCALAADAPSDARWPYMAGYQCAQQERWAQAIKHYSASLRLDGRYLKAWYRTAQACSRSGRHVDAQLAAARVLKLWHECKDEKQRERDAQKMARASYLLARGQLRADPAGAVELLRQAMERCPRDANFHYLLGKALRRSGAPSEAIPELEAADRIAPRKSYQQLELVAALSDAGQRERAERLLVEIACHCRGWDAYKAGTLALAVGNPALAVESLRHALNRGPSKGDPKIAEALRRAERDALATASPGRGGHARHSRKTGQPPPQMQTGKVVTLRPERAFGFLEDERGTRRHFRLKGPPDAFSRGASVRFRPTEEKKGPAARDVQPIA
jgi:tetratricopeptide (TPR) repeat protein/cold shock CspA family protein